MVRTLRRAMPEAGVRTADNGLEAQILLGSYLPDLIVLDIMMPSMNGVDLVRFLKANERYAGVKTLLMTGLGEGSESVRQARTLGVENILFKPFKPEELVEAIRGLFPENPHVKDRRSFRSGRDRDLLPSSV